MSTLREAIESAMDSSNETDAAVEAPAATSGAEEPQASAPDAPNPPAVDDSVDDSTASKLTKPPTDAKPAGDRPRGPDGKFAPAPKGADKGAPAKLAAPGADSAVAPAQPAAPKAAAPPSSWKATAREVWAQIPPAAQAEIAKREHEVRQALGEASQARKSAETWQRAVAPYEASIRANGGDPAATIGQLLQTQQALHFGTADVKAQLIAKMIHEFGVRPHGEAFVNALVPLLEGRPGAPQMAPQEFRDPRFDQLMAQMQQAQAQRQQVVLTQAQTEAQSFASAHEFFDDVRETMADLLEVADKQGRTMSLEDAYNKAIAFHPDVAQIVEQRKAAERAKQGNANIQRARVAGSSLRTQSAPAIGSDGKQQSLRGQIEAAMDALSR